MSQLSTYALRIAEHTTHKRYSQAIALASEAIKAFPRCAALYAQRGQAYFLVENDYQAEKDFDKAVELEPTTRRYLRRAAFLLNLHRPLDALQDCYAALEIEPENTAALTSLEACKQLMK